MLRVRSVTHAHCTWTKRNYNVYLYARGAPTMMEQETEPEGADAETVDDEREEDKIEETTLAQDFCLEILPFIKQSQNQRGLRHGDYQRYRHYCSRRMRRIRRLLNFTYGHRHRFQKKVLTVEKVTELRYLYLPLVCAERSWAMAMELKQEINSDPRKKFHLLRRLKKAAKHAKHLLQLSEACERCDARTRLEAQAYKCWMSANVKFEQQKWQQSLEEFGQCQTIYEKLGGAVPDDQKAVYAQRVEEMVPNIRYCAYNIGDSTDVAELVKLRPDAPGLASKIDDVLSKTQEKAASSLSEVMWREQRLPVRNERLRVGLIKLQQLEGELRGRRTADGDEGKMEMYEQLLMECQDAMQIVREDIAAETSLSEKKKRSQKAEVHVDTLRQLMDYLTHFKLTVAIDRNLHLFQTMKNPKPGARNAKPEEFVRVFDILLQHVTDLGDILGAEDLTSQKYIAALTLAFKSFRCYYLSESYVVMRKWAEAVGLLDRALEHVTQSLEQYRSLEQGTVSVNVKVDQEKVSSV
jgi:signal recognition particle subunit SRP68